MMTCCMISQGTINPFTPKSANCKFPLQPHQKYLLTYTFLFKRLGECYFLELSVSERVNPFTHRVINVKIPLQPHKKYDITQYGELDFS